MSETREESQSLSAENEPLHTGEISQTTLYTVVERCPFGIYIVDDAFRIAAVNEGSQKGAFVNVRPVVGRPFDEAIRVLWPEPVATEIINIFRHTLATGETYYSRDFTKPRSDVGQTESYEWEVHRIALPSGRHGAVCYYFDSTRLRQAETEVRDGEQRMRLATEATSVGIWQWHIATGEIRWDAQMFRIYGVPPTSDGCVPYDTWRRAVLPEDLARQEELLQETLRRQGRNSREFRIRRASDGECRVVASVEAARTGAGGKVEWMVGTNLDITDRKRAEDEMHRLAAALSDADRRKDEFLATLAHELRNPLAAVRSAVKFLQLNGPAVPELQCARDIIERQTRAMVRLIDDLMDVSRISQGKIALQLEHVELAKIVESAVEACGALIDEMGHELTVTLQAGPVMVKADPTRLTQVILNLLSNAAKYTERGGRIHLRAELEGGDVLVCVKDSGIGIPADKLGGIFEMFSQVEGALSRSQGGLGVGLCLVKRLVEMHGGRVEAKSDGVGKGSEFVVRLPIVAAKNDAAPMRDEGDKSTPTSALRVLVVEDHRDNARVLAMLVKRMGNTVQTVHDGEEAVAAARAFRPHVVLCDIGLPRMSGYEACRQMKQQAWDPKMIVIALTGWGQDEDRKKSAEAGFDDHLVKPVDLNQLMKLLADLDSARQWPRGGDEPE